MAKAGSWKMQYRISGGQDDGKVFNLSFRECTDEDWSKFNGQGETKNSKYPAQRIQKQLQAHRDFDTFMCPDAFDLSFWGMLGDED